MSLRAYRDETPTETGTAWIDVTATHDETLSNVANTINAGIGATPIVGNANSIAQAALGWFGTLDIVGIQQNGAGWDIESRGAVYSTLLFESTPNYTPGTERVASTREACHQRDLAAMTPWRQKMNSWRDQVRQQHGGF